MLKPHFFKKGEQWWARYKGELFGPWYVIDCLAVRKTVEIWERYYA